MGQRETFQVWVVLQVGFQLFECHLTKLILGSRVKKFSATGETNVTSIGHREMENHTFLALVERWNYGPNA